MATIRKIGGQANLGRKGQKSGASIHPKTTANPEISLHPETLPPASFFFGTTQLAKSMPKKRRYTKEAIDEVVVLLKEGLPYREITLYTNIPSSSVSDIAKAKGLIRGRGNSKNHPHHQNQHKKPRARYSKYREQALAFYGQGQSLRAIAAELGITHQNVSFLLKNPKKM